MAFGISDSGFSIPSLDQIKQEITQSFIASFGTNINTADSSKFGQVIGVQSEREYLLWAAMQDVYNSQYPATAFGVSLDNVGDISGIPRLKALPSTLLGLKLFGTPGTVVPGVMLPASSTRFAVLGSPNNVFQLDAPVVLGAGQDCIQMITFSGVPTAGQWTIGLGGVVTSALAFNANAATVQTAIRTLPFAAGSIVTGDYTSGFMIQFSGAGTGGLMEQSEFITPTNTLQAGMSVVNIAVIIMQAGIDQGVGNVTAVDTGPTLANAGTLTVIVTPISGLTNSINVIDATLGRNVETDNEYRARRQVTLQVAGAGTLEAIRSRLLSLSGVTAVIVFENVTLITDPDGRPGKSFEAVVQGGDDNAIANLLWQVKPAGILTDGTITVTITDSQGQPHDIHFSRPTNVPIYVILELSTNSSYPSNGDAGIRQAIVNAGNALGIGKEVVPIPYLIASIAPTPGIEDANLYVGFSPNPTLSDNLPIAPNEISAWDTSRVSIVHI
jgi:uncharacterized phage protein gp47/JayE